MSDQAVPLDEADLYMQRCVNSAGDISYCARGVIRDLPGNEAAGSACVYAAMWVLGWHPDLTDEQKAALSDAGFVQEMSVMMMDVACRMIQSKRKGLVTP